MMAALTTGQIQAQVSAIRKKKTAARAFALHSKDGWSGPDRLQIDGIEHLLLPCVSDLQMREALLIATKSDKPAVLLCSVGSEELGDDVVARLAKQRIFAPQAKDILAALFSAGIVDPRVFSTKPLVDALIDRVPAGGYTPVAGGSLDLEHAWTALIEQILGSSIAGPSLRQLLDWSFDPAKIKALTGLEPQLKQAFVDWLARTRGESIRFMMAALDSGADLVPLGLALGLVFSPELQKGSEFSAARARLEKYFGGKDIDPESARAWFRAAEGAVPQLTEEHNLQFIRALFKRVDVLLEELKLGAFAYMSNHSPAGLAARFDRLGKALQAAIKTSNDTDEVVGCFSHIRQHLLSPAEDDRIARAEMALRLIRWLKSSPPETSSLSFSDIMESYHRDGGFLDWARNRLRETDVSTSLQTAFTRILEQVDEHALHVEKGFAEKLAEWTKSEQESGRLIRIEDVLSKVVIPAAKTRPVLLLVLDGMSVAVFRQLLRDVTRQDWTEIANDELPCPVLATLPSVTQISRRALFLGRLEPGKQGTEKGEFSGNELLFHATGSQVRPKLFLKGDLQEENQNALATGVRDAIADKKCRVVGVVVNAIDDHLDSGDQVVFTWGLDRIKPLRELFKLAMESDRLVLMTSDHGHVLDFGTKLMDAHEGESGDRYRMGDEPPNAEEISFEGSRIEKATGQKQVVLAWNADARYGPKKRGYHGGANPQEMVVPLAILSGPNTTPADGWKEIPPYEPDWWRITAGDFVATTATPAKTKAVEAVKGLDLFEQATVKKQQETGFSWIETLLDSQIYQEQLKLAVRGGPQPDVIITLLTSIEARGGSIMKASLAQALGVPLFRVDGLVQNVSRILNLDGYEVLSFDRSSDTITLNTNLLKTQFDLK